MRVEGSVEKVNVLVVIGVGTDGVKQVLALQAGDKESSSNWRQLFRDLKTRGLDSS
jgi:putative transposase